MISCALASELKVLSKDVARAVFLSCILSPISWLPAWSRVVCARSVGDQCASYWVIATCHCIGADATDRIGGGTGPFQAGKKCSSGWGGRLVQSGGRKGAGA